MFEMRHVIDANTNGRTNVSTRDFIDGTYKGISETRHRTYAENQPLGFEAERAIDRLRERVGKPYIADDVPEGEPDRLMTSLELVEDELRRIHMYVRENRMMLELLNARASGKIPEGEPDRLMTSLELVEDELRRIHMYVRENRMMLELLNARASGEIPEGEGKEAAVRSEPAGQIARLHYLTSLASHELHRQSEEIRKLTTVL
jgi:hypothetical protein